MQKWRTGLDVMARWGINYMELQSCILDDGLKAYDKNGAEIHFRNRADFKREWTEYRSTWASDNFPNSYRPQRIDKTLTYTAANLYFPLQDVEAFEKSHQIDRQDLKQRPSTEDKKEIVRQAKAIWEDNPETRENMARTLHKFSPGAYYSEHKIQRWLQDEKYGRSPGRLKKTTNIK